MHRIPLVRVAAILPVRRFLTRIAAPVDRFLARVHIPRDVFAHPEALIPLTVAANFLSEAARSQGIDVLGALVGQDTSLETMGMFGRRIARTANLQNALATAAGIIPNHDSGERFWFDTVAGEPRFCHRFTRRLDDWGQQAEQYSLTCTLRFLKSVAGPAWQPRTVYLTKGIPRSIADMELLRGSAAVFDQGGWAITLSGALLQRPMPRASSATDTPSDWRRWLSSAPASDFAGAVAQVVTTLLRAGQSDVALLATWLGISVRTLQRRLEDAGVSYGRVLAKARLEAAVGLLDDRRVRLQDIARTLGYSDPAHFTRAFRRWTGSAPRTFRQLNGRAPGHLLAGNGAASAAVPIS
jgi:AraC-like DNA-binding protein